MLDEVILLEAAGHSSHAWTHKQLSARLDAFNPGLQTVKMTLSLSPTPSFSSMQFLVLFYFLFLQYNSPGQKSGHWCLS